MGVAETIYRGGVTGKSAGKGTSEKLIFCEQVWKSDSYIFVSNCEDLLNLTYSIYSRDIQYIS